MKGKVEQDRFIWVNNAIKADLRWALDKVENSTGVHLLNSLAWKISDATHVIYCDACLTGLGFWFPKLNLGFYADTPPDPDFLSLVDDDSDEPLEASLIFFFESLCVLSALRDAALRSDLGSRFAIFTDNSNTVSIFSSLRCRPPYNPILREAVNIFTDGDHDLRVLHIAGADNGIADALSRKDFNRAISLNSNLNILPFEPYSRQKVNKLCVLQPPRDALGAVEN
ncbi:hypothetical protein CVT26_009370 [Gymnopilus dilepis]|uniref:Uncharacterized protein n=1 Tax=Gymnopilus dilepis TaxID=231916 RepID=A0A409WZJ4_9AGAR|nr:hypothetical protein CVT26_009370 [Gymnopilus dilepis]